MLVYGVEGERSAASLVKDSKAYIEIAKFVEAYTTIIQNPNEFLTEIGEETINPETDILSWKQLVKILTTCDLGFDPVPTEKQLVSYYAYARQIGSISKDIKPLATVSDVAEAQKHYYNFVDEETEKMTTIYNKQHEITENRAKEVEQIDSNLKKMKAKNYVSFTGMMISTLFVMLGVASALFDLLGFGSPKQYIFGAIFIILGIVGFVISDKFYIKTKRTHFNYFKNTRETVTRFDKTNLDEKVLRDKLARYENDLKIAKFELADKEKRFDVEKNIEILREKNKYYSMLRDRDRDGKSFEGFGKGRRMSLINELEASNSESLLSIFGGDKKRAKKNPQQPKAMSEEGADLFRVGRGAEIDLRRKASRDDLTKNPLLDIEKAVEQASKNHFNKAFVGSKDIKPKYFVPESRYGEEIYRRGLDRDFLLRGRRPRLSRFSDLDQMLDQVQQMQETQQAQETRVANNMNQQAVERKEREDKYEDIKTKFGDDKKLKEKLENDEFKKSVLSEAGAETITVGQELAQKFKEEIMGEKGAQTIPVNGEDFKKRFEDYKKKKEERDEQNQTDEKGERKTVEGNDKDFNNQQKENSDRVQQENARRLKEEEERRREEAERKKLEEELQQGR